MCVVVITGVGGRWKNKAGFTWEANNTTLLREAGNKRHMSFGRASEHGNAAVCAETFIEPLYGIGGWLNLHLISDGLTRGDWWENSFFTPLLFML